MRILDNLCRRERSGLKGAVHEVNSETLERSGDRRIDYALYDEGGFLQEETHKLASTCSAVKTTFTYESNDLLEEKTYSNDRLLNSTIHTYSGGLPISSRFYGADGVLREEYRYSHHSVDRVGLITSTQFGDRPPSVQAFRMASSFYLKLNGVVAEHRLIATSGRVLAKFFLSHNTTIHGLGLATYDTDDRLIFERFLIGSAPFSDVFTIPSDLEPVAAISYQYSLDGLQRTETLTQQQGWVSTKTITYDPHGNPLYKSVKTDTTIDHEQVTAYVYKYDGNWNWIERLVKLRAHLSINDSVVRTSRRIDYF